MDRSFASHGFIVLAYGSPMGHPWVYNAGPWVTLRGTMLAHGSPMGQSWVAGGPLIVIYS